MKALLIGNDINNINNAYSWKMLLQDLVEYARLSPLTTEGKPFPLLYEEIFLNAVKQYGAREKRIKTYIAAKTCKMQPNEIHHQILKMDVPVLLTTNYDLTLEAAANHKAALKNSGVVRESLYSLYRVSHLPAQQIWHMHGQALHPATITLGYEHYSGYLQQMRNYVVSGSGNEAVSLLQQLKENSVKHKSWVDYFFTHDIHILGLNLDFVEIHLWWLLTFRARAKWQHRIEINNNIYYYLPQQFESKSRHKLELLQTNGVQPVSLTMKANNRTGYYQRVLSKINST